MDAPRRLVLLGHPVSHSISPLFQNAALRAAALNLRYEAVDVAPEQLDDLLEVLSVEQSAGNVTIPHKEPVASKCTRLSPLAAEVGAVNTFWHEDGQLVGDNSDVGGAELVMRALVGANIHGGSIALIGAGGSAASIIVAAKRCGARSVRVYNRSRSRAEQLAARFASIASATDSVDDAMADSCLVVNATPVGLSGNDLPVAVERLPREAAVFDLAYAPGETAWVRAARAAGHRSADGEGMLLEQGAISFERWFGFAPDRSAMWKSIR